MDLSIIVPVYNVEKYIRPCIESIFQQGLDDDDFEVIIVNDGTKDHSMEVIADIIELHHNITVINQENQGLSVARNNGIAAAKGEYILMPDSDDLLIENSLKPLLEKALETKKDIIVADFLIMNNHEIEQLSKNKIQQHAIYTQEITGLELLKELKACYVWNKLYRHEYLLRYHLTFIPGIGFEDIPFTNECYLNTPNCLKVNIFLNVYRRGHSSDSDPNSFNIKKTQDLCKAIAATWKLSNNENITSEARKTIKKKLLANYYNLVFRLLKYIDNSSDRVEVLKFLHSLAPDLRFSYRITQHIGSWLSRKAPRLYLSLQSLHWHIKLHHSN